MALQVLAAPFFVCAHEKNGCAWRESSIIEIGNEIGGDLQNFVASFFSNRAVLLVR